jgi:hypothetical protein
MFKKDKGPGGGLHEDNEFSDKTRIIGKQLSEDIKPAIVQIEEEQTRRNLEGQTVRIGKTLISTIVDEFWKYYQQFTSAKLPKPDEYLGGKDEAELKIMVLLGLLQDHYIERVYPRSTRFPIVHYRYFGSKTREQKKGKFFFVADTHGSFKDTLKMIHHFTKEIEKGIKENYEVKIVFIGDFVDRHELDIHNTLYIAAFNLKYPNNVLMLRGNHEEVSINANYGFGKNVMDHFSKMLFAQFNNVFKDLPLICIFHCFEGNICCLHGGIPLIVDPETRKYSVPDLNTWEFNNRKIFVDDMDEITQQILWNDPITDYDPQSSEPYYPNRRGLGYIFGQPVFDEFCQKNNIHLVFRGHQVFTEGIRKFFNGFVSFFSATDYVKSKIRARCIEMNSDDVYGYKVIEIQKDLPD